MGVEYQLFDFATKQYIGLGKRLRLAGRAGYQMPPDRIKAFCRGRKRLVMLTCGARQPIDDDDSWTCLGHWWWEGPEYALFERGLMGRDGHNPLNRPDEPMP